MTETTTGMRRGFSPVHLVLIVVVAAVNALLSIASSVLPVVPGLASFYLPAGFMSAAGFWFGPWGILGGILSGLLYAPYWGMPLYYGFLSGLTDALYAAGPYLIWKPLARRLKLDPKLTSKRDLVVWFVSIVVTCALNAWTYGAMIVYIFGWTTPEVMWGGVVYLSWLTQTVTALIISYVLLKTLSRYVMRTPLYVRGWIY